ncbi:unnamed protein product [Oppiella nova]|uniref:HIT-type domain-containing protein n=1 Tax=Oppiella nova TaxID=334625 RepID=A0A7R9M4T0_9ACAR|nr:unnamed protein product [Oppiella nova]CAG2170747.1 unnamed protein product [Oppiella nova]
MFVLLLLLCLTFHSMMDSMCESMCDFCVSKKWRYRCSRCHRRYCSSDCFRSAQHMQCSEEFFRQCVTQELMSRRFDDSSKRRLLEILQRNGSQLTDDLISGEDNTEDIVEEGDDSEDTFEARFKHLDINDSHCLWNQLSDSEKQEFNELLKSGKIGDIVDVWKPWWESASNDSTKPLVTPLDEPTVAQTSDNVPNIPQLVSNITKLEELISKPVSPTVCPAVVNTLFSYCYICRVFNGEYDSIESIDVFVSKCPQLCKRINCQDLSQSLQMCVQEVMTEQPSQMAIQLLYDLKCLIDGPKLKTQCSESPEYVLRALNDLICIINKVKTKCSKSKRKDIELLAKKLQFYMSWSVANGLSLVETTVQINLMIDTMLLMENSNQLQENSEDLRTKLRPKTLITEID